MAKKLAVLLLIAFVVFGADAEAQYYSERMAPPTTLPPLTTELYDIRSDAKTAQAIQDATVRRERLDRFKTAVEVLVCVPLCAVPVSKIFRHERAQECVFNCLVQGATDLLPDDPPIYLTDRWVPRDSKRHPSHPPLRKRIERLQKVLRRR